jgi:hypothetical protein
MDPQTTNPGSVNLRRTIIGLQLFTAPYGMIYPGQAASWNYWPPRYQSDREAGVETTSYLQWLEFWRIGFGTEPGGPAAPFLYAGILGANGWVGQPGGIAAWSYAGNGPQVNQTTEGAGYWVQFWNGEPGRRDQSGKFGIIGITSGDATVSTPQTRSAAAGAAAVEVADEGAPATSEPSISPWTRQGQILVSGRARDTGLGVKSVLFQVPGVGSRTITYPCTGNSESPCALTNYASIAVNASELPQGSTAVSVRGTDPVGNMTSEASASKAIVRVDRTAPTLTLSGSATQQASLGTTLPRYALTVKAADGTSSAPQSGVVETMVKVDNQLADQASPGCTTSNCAITRSVTLTAERWGFGAHSVEVFAKDGVGLSAPVQKFILSFSPDSTKPQISKTGTIYAAPEGWVTQKTYTFNASATDAHGSGVTELKLSIDGAVVRAVRQTCNLGECGMSFGVANLDMHKYAGGAHTATLIAVDGASNLTEQTWTINVDPSGQVTNSEAGATLEAMEATTDDVDPLAPPEAEQVLMGEGGTPGIRQTGPGEFESTGTPAASEFTAGENIVIETEDGSHIVITPVSTPGISEAAASGEVAAVESNSHPATDTVVRPKYNGILQFEQIREPSSPVEFSWEVSLLPGQELIPVPGGQYAAVYFEDGTQMMLIEAMPAHDATGHAVPTSLAVTGPNVITLTVNHHAGAYVYPVIAGPSYEVGYSTVEFFMPPPESPSLEGGTPGWEGYTVVSSPVLAEGGATASSVWKEESFKKVICSHSATFGKKGFTLLNPITASLASFEEHCGDPWHNDPGIYVAYREGLHGRFLQMAPNSKTYAEVRHEGSATESIGCVAEADNEPLETQRRASKETCVWWGPTNDGGGASARWGKHITPVSFNFGEQRGSCGDECNGTPNPWQRFEMPPMAFYLWADGHYKFHETRCVDC